MTPLILLIKKYGIFTRSQTLSSDGLYEHTTNGYKENRHRTIILSITQTTIIFILGGYSVHDMLRYVMWWWWWWHFGVHAVKIDFE